MVAFTTFIVGVALMIFGAYMTATDLSRMLQAHLAFWSPTATAISATPSLTPELTVRTMELAWSSVPLILALSVFGFGIALATAGVIGYLYVPDSKSKTVRPTQPANPEKPGGMS